MNKNIALEFVRVTEAAAIACAPTLDEFLTIKDPARKTRPVNIRLRKKRGMNL